MDVVIVGGGIAGLVSGWELARNGCSVTVVDRGKPGHGASRAAAGMLAPVAEARFGEGELTRLGTESLRRWPEFARALEDASGLSVDYRTEGTLVVAVDRDDLGALEHTHRLHQDMGLPAHMLDGDAARELEPLLAPNIPGAVHCPTDHQVDPRLVVDALAAAFVAAGGAIVTGVEVRGIRAEHGRAVGLDADGFESPSDATYIIAAGAWTRTLEGLGADRPHVRPVRGQMLSVELGDPPLCSHVIRSPDAYLVPKSDGRLLIGATMEEVGFDDRLTAGGVMDLLVGAWETLPAVYDQAIVEMWAGFRPISLDGEPILRRSDSLDNVVYATGHGRNGVLLAPVTASRVHELVTRLAPLPRKPPSHGGAVES